MPQVFVSLVCKLLFKILI